METTKEKNAAPIYHHLKLDDLENKAVAELRSIIRGLKKAMPLQENLVNISGVEIVKLSKNDAMRLIMGVYMDSSKEDSTKNYTEDEAEDITEILGGTSSNNGSTPKTSTTTSLNRSTNGTPKLDTSQGLGGLEGYFIQLIKQFSTASIDEKQISKMLESKIGPIIEELKQGITSKIELRKYDGSKVKIDVCHKDTKKAINILSTRENGKRINLFLSGGAGGGKTTLGSIIAKALDVPFYPVSVGGQTTEAKLIGFTSPIDGEYKMTPLGKAVKFGGLWMGDEIDSSNSNTVIVLNTLLSNESVMFGNELVPIHDDFNWL